MTTMELEKSVTFKNILVATDFSDASKHALQCAAAITESNEGKLFLLHAVPPEPRLPVPLDPLPVSADRELSEAKLTLEKVVSAEPLGHLHPEEILVRGPVGEVVLDAIQREKVDLLVLGTHGRTGFKKLILGSVAEELFRRASCPVLTVGPSAAPVRPIRKVLFATDFGPSSIQALPYAIDFANQTGGELTLLHLVAPFPVDYVGPLWYPGTDVVEREEASKLESLKRLRDLLPSNSGLSCYVDHAVEVHLAPEGIVNFAKQHDVDLIVMGLRESSMNTPRLSAHMPWATAYDVVCHAECPVLTVRGLKAAKATDRLRQARSL
ncbi:MAG: universal stress protein [Terriglobales bacterium]